MDLHQIFHIGQSTWLECVELVSEGEVITIRTITGEHVLPNLPGTLITAEGFDFVSKKSVRKDVALLMFLPRGTTLSYARYTHCNYTPEKLAECVKSALDLFPKLQVGVGDIDGSSGIRLGL
jgi:hypothetical protein